jgi:hypothetical protein
MLGDIQKYSEKGYLFTPQRQRKRHFETPSPYAIFLRPFLRTLVLGYVKSKNTATIAFSATLKSNPKTTDKRSIKNITTSKTTYYNIN